jgi:hypothetical protein
MLSVGSPEQAGDVSPAQCDSGMMRCRSTKTVGSLGFPPAESYPLSFSQHRVDGSTFEPHTPNQPQSGTCQEAQI